MIAPAGKIVVASVGTPIAVSANLPAQPTPFKCHGVMFQVLPTNTGRVYIGDSTMDRTAYTGLYAMLAIPTVNVLPSFSAALTISPNGLNLTNFYVDADQSGDGVIVTYLVT